MMIESSTFLLFSFSYFYSNGFIVLHYNIMIGNNTEEGSLNLTHNRDLVQAADCRDRNCMHFEEDLDWENKERNISPKTENTRTEDQDFNIGDFKTEEGVRIQVEFF